MRILVLGGDGYLGWPTRCTCPPRATSRRSSTTPSAAVRPRARVQQPGADRDARRPASHAWEEVDRQADHDLHRRPARRRLHVRGDPRVPAGRDRALRRAARGAVLDDRPQARRLHADQQRRRHAQPDVRHRRDQPRHPPRQARHDGRVRHAEHRHRGGLARGRRTTAAPTAMLFPKQPGSLLPPVQGARQPQPRVRLPHLGAARHRPQPGRRLRPGDRRRPRSTRGWRPGFDYDAVFGTVLNRFVDPGRARPAAHRLRRRRPDRAA